MDSCLSQNDGVIEFFRADGIASIMILRLNPVRVFACAKIIVGQHGFLAWPSADMVFRCP